MDFKLPEIGEGVHEGELIKWLVKDGDSVTVDQPLLEVMTDKATVEVPSPTAGTIRGIKSKDGDMIKVGSTLATIEEGAGKAAAPTGQQAAPQSAPQAAPAKAPAAAAPQSQPASQGQPAAQNAGQGSEQKNPSPANSGEGTSTPDENRRQQQAPAHQNGGGSNSNGSYGGNAGGGNAGGGNAGGGNAGSGTAGGAYQSALEQNSTSSVPAAPIVRAMAQKSGVDLASVTGTGPDVGDRKRVLEQDLMNYLNQSQQAPAQSTQVAMPAKAATQGQPAAGQATPGAAPQFPTRTVIGSQDTERVPMRGLRRVIAQAMVRSKYTAPHYSYVDEFECSQFVALREEAKKMGEKVGVKVTYLPFIIKAVVAALKQFPVVNSSLEENANGMELVYKKYYHIGFAVATPDGLVVPVIKHADKKTLLEIAHEMTELSNKVRAGKAAADDLKGSTFTITSMGNIGGLFATPIINYPEVGIMGVYKVQEKPIVQDGKIVIGKTMHLSLSLDHRVVDGAVGGYFCNAIIERLQNPARLLLDMV